MECGGDGEEEEQRETVDERTDLLSCTAGHGRHPPQTRHARRYPQLQQQQQRHSIAMHDVTYTLCFKKRPPFSYDCSFYKC